MRLCDMSCPLKGSSWEKRQELRRPWALSWSVSLPKQLLLEPLQVHITRGSQVASVCRCKGQLIRYTPECTSHTWTERDEQQTKDESCCSLYVQRSNAQLMIYANWPHFLTAWLKVITCKLKASCVLVTRGIYLWMITKVKKYNYADDLRCALSKTNSSMPQS